jgi:signal transduction histidine kinase/CheY-like chemotaxis protein
VYDVEMKNRLIAFFLIILGALSGNSAPLVPDSLFHVADRILVVQGDHYYPPFEFINEDGEPDGFNVELFRAMAEMLGLKYTIELGPWKQVRANLEEGRCDVLLGLMVSDQRAEKMLFGTPHSMMTHGIFARKGETYKNIEALRNKEIVVQDRDLMHDWLLQSGFTEHVVAVSTQLEALHLIAAGKHDAALIGNFQGEHLLRDANIHNVHMTSGHIQPVKYAMAVGKEDDELIWLLNIGLYQLKASGQYQELYDKWFGVYESKDFFRTYKIHITLMATALLILILFVIMLRVRVKQATKSLEAAKTKAEENDRLKTAFLNNISHEIRTPLNGILGFTEVICEESGTPQLRNHYRKLVEQCSQRLLDTMEDILTIARIEAGQEAPELAPIDIKELVEQLDLTFGPSAKAAGLILDLIIEIPEHQQVFLTDRQKLWQILSKLLSNAIKFTPQGSISLRCLMENQLIHFIVTDTGIGMSQESLGLIFERFRQISIGNTQGHDGVGLGLTIARAYVDMLEGQLTVDSSPGVGSRFQLQIPYSISETQDHPAMQTIPLNPEKQSQTRSFIVAEDDEINFQLLETILSISFYDPVIHRALNGEEVLSILQNHPDTEAILMDLKMPVMDGYEATRRVKQSHPDIIIIAITAYALVNDKEKAMAAGCDAYLSKPLLKGDLLKTLASMNIIPDTF